MSATLAGDLRHFFPAEILQLLALAQASGRLDLERSGERALVIVEGGRPVFARTDGPCVRTGELLVHHGALPATALAGMLAQPAGQPGLRLGERLIHAGLTSRDEVERAVRESLRRVLYGLLLWRDGSFRFTPGDGGINLDIRLEADLDRLILEGLRQADESRAPAVPA